MRAEEAYLVDGLPPKWALAVAQRIKSVAEQTEPLFQKFGYRGVPPYQDNLTNPKWRGLFQIHAKLYSRALWLECNKEIPSHVAKWIAGKTISGPKYSTLRRLNYLLDRRSAMAWWDKRGRSQQNSRNIYDRALEFRGILEILHLSAKLGDMPVLQHVVRERLKSRENKIHHNVRSELLAWWMEWSLWRFGYDKIVVILKSRRRIDVSRSTVSRHIRQLKLRPEM